mmetsp:Transcript_9209/g.22285  ORF Transcript_9209/g.22285 Transcript_9209/m.22285 type:complete len:212 (-) Transcript_9209:53-688(-)
MGTRALGEELHAHEPEDNSHALLQILQVLDSVCKHRVETPQANDGEDIGCESDEGISGHAEDSGDRVNGEQDVRELHAHEHKEEGRGATQEADEALWGRVLHAPARKEASAVELARGVERFRGPLDHRIVTHVLVLVLLTPRNERVRGVDEEGPKEHHHRVELLHEQESATDEDSTQYDGSCDSKREAPLLEPERHAEVLEEEDKDEEVVH